jgi:hypothetical protein
MLRRSGAPRGIFSGFQTDQLTRRLASRVRVNVATLLGLCPLTYNLLEH